ncbi:MAG: DUF4402 domain-containing protein [Alphaproteobacteria bacterium]
MRLEEKSNGRRIGIFLASGVLFCAPFCTTPAAAFAPRRDADSVMISEVTRMDFGTIAIPFSGSQSLALNPANSNETGTGNRLSEMPSRGVYLLKSHGHDRDSMTIDIGGVETNSPHLKLDDFTGIYDNRLIAHFPSPAVGVPGNAGTKLYLGATETVTSSMRPGAPNPSFDITVIVN